MRKIIIILVWGLLIGSAEAGCGYRDLIGLSPYLNSGVRILDSLSGTEQLRVTKIGFRTFEIRDYSCEDGYVYVPVYYDNANSCELTIQDGPGWFFWRGPKVVNVSCRGGLTFNYMEDNGDGTYTLNFY